MTRVLVVDDDPLSLCFLEVAVAECGCTVATAADGASALATDSPFDLLMLDRRLPDIGGAELLHALRARGVMAPAIATSAEVDAELAARLRAAGFADVLEKPASVATIAELLTRHLPRNAPVTLDDAAALSAIGGDPDALRALRGLFARELEQLERDLAGDDLATAPLIERLHRLRASCGFCGANALSARAAEWQDALRTGNPPASDRRDAFLAECRVTASALRRQSVDA